MCLPEDISLEECLRIVSSYRRAVLEKLNADNDIDISRSDYSDVLNRFSGPEREFKEYAKNSCIIIPCTEYQCTNWVAVKDKQLPEGWKSHEFRHSFETNEFGWVFLTCPTCMARIRANNEI